MWFKTVVLLVALTAYADAFSSGAPESACVDMVPKHPVPPQKSVAPYVLTPSSKVVKAGTPVEIAIKGQDVSHTIGGLLLQARHGDKPIGKFSVPPGDYYKLIDCGGEATAITHKKHDENINRQAAAFTWTPPADFSGEIKFRATVAYNGAVFWVGIESAPVKVTA